MLATKERGLLQIQMGKRDRDTMEEILIEGEGQRPPKGSAKLGFFQSKSGGQFRTENANNVFVLVVHYDFKGIKGNERKWDEGDVKNLKTTFGKNRKCNFRSLHRPKKEIFLEILGSQENLLRYFNSKDKIPSVFVLFFLSHGNENGVIYTDYWSETLNDFISFTTKEVFECLNQLHGFEKSLKLVNFGPCRGELDDAKFDPNKYYPCSYNNQNSCRITMAPEIPNIVIFYSTVETTTAKTSEDGSWFVKIVCDVLNQMSEDKPLLIFLTSVQYAMHKVSLIDKEDLSVGQTPEVKMFSLGNSFFLRAAAKSVSRTDSELMKAAKIPPASNFLFSWKSDKGKNIRGRRAFIFYEQKTNEVEEMEKALRTNLDFETRSRNLNDVNLISYSKQVHKMEHDVGCVFTFIFGQVSARKKTEELCVLVGGREISIMDIIHESVGPKNDRLIGKPKIFFIIDQEALKRDSYSPRMFKFEDASTNHSGWLVMILKDKDLLNQLIGIFKGNELKKRKKSLQELLVPLLTTGTKKELTLLNSTLQYLLNFPNLPRTFVKPDFKLGDSGKKICFEDLIKEAKMLRENNEVWLLSSVAGAGKTTVLKEIAFQIGKSDQDARVLNISLMNNFQYIFNIFRVDEVELLVETTGYSYIDIENWIAKKRIVVFLDGFDEICPHSRDKILKIVRALKERKVPLCVATRPHEAKVIKEAVGKAKLVEIEPFDKEKQKEFLRFVIGDSKEEIERVLHAVKQKGFSSPLHPYFRVEIQGNILVHPLHLLLVAEFSGEGNLFKIYDKVMKKKVRLCLERENGNEKVADLRVEIALKLLRLIAFRFTRNEPLVGDGVTIEDLARMNDFGVATVEQEMVSFIHPTYAEFLAAQQILKNVKESSTFVNEFLGNWPRTFVKPDFKVRGSMQQISFDDLIKEMKMLREKHQVWLLSSIAGSGKTTVLKEIALQIGNFDQDAKILNISLLRHQFYISQKRRVDPIEFLVETTGNSTEDVTSWIAQNRIVVFLDGFDEICPHIREKCIAIVSALKERRVPLCVSTRPHEAKVIEEAVGNVKLIQIELFNIAKQIEFLLSVFDKDEEEIKRVLHFVKQIGHSNSRYRDENEDTILVNPLHLSLVAQCEANLFQIYDKMVRKKVQLCLERKYGWEEVTEDSIENAVNLLQLIAFRFIKNEPLVGPGVTKEDLAKMNDYGVATVEQETVTFLHQTFAEFLAAQHFLKNVKESSNFDMEFFCNFIELLCKSKCDADSKAVNFTNDEILEFFLENGFNVNFSFDKDSNRNALFLACQFGRFKCVQVLLKHGAKKAITYVPVDNSFHIWDPLYLAVKWGHLDIVKLFVEEEISGLARDEVTFEADIFQTDEENAKEYKRMVSEKNNAFHCAVFYRKKEIAEYLLSKSPDLKHIPTGKGKSPLQLAVECRNGEILLWLAREVGDDLSSFIPRGETQSWTEKDHFIYDHFLLLQGDLAKTDERGKTLLHCAAHYGYLQLVREFIAAGTNVTAKDVDGRNALHFACAYTKFSDEMDNSEVVKLLHRTNPRLAKETTNEGETAIHIFASSGYESWSRETFRFLVGEAGVDLKAKDSNGRTAEDVANDKYRSLWNNLIHQ